MQVQGRGGSDLSGHVRWAGGMKPPKANPVCDREAYELRVEESYWEQSQ